MDKILIQELELITHIGHIPEERVTAQRIVLNIELTVDTTGAYETKDLDNTVCYATVVEEYKKQIETQEWILIEEAIEALVTHTFSRFLRVESVKLQLRKFSVPKTAWVAVEVNRTRSDYVT